MRYSLDALFTSLITQLTVTTPILKRDNDPVGVYTEAPRDSEFPMVLLEPSGMTEYNDNNDDTDEAHLIEIRIISKYQQGAGGWGENNHLVNEITKVLRVKNQYINIGDDFDIMGQRIFSITPIRDSYEDAVYFETIILFEFKIQDLS